MVSILERRSTFWFVAGLIALLFAITDLPLRLDDFDQAKQAFTSFEMVHDGHWFYQHTPKSRVATKPPLIGWISAGLYGLTGSWNLAWRLPSMVAALLLIALLTRAAARAYGTTAALVAMAAGGLNLLAPPLATLVRTDMPLALVVFLLGLKIWQKIRRAEAWEAHDRRVMFALLLAAMWIKGPIVFAFLLPGIVFFQWSEHGSAEKVSAWCGWWPWIVSLGVFLLWVAGGVVSVPQFWDEVVVREFASRFSETVHRPQPFYFYLPHLLHKFAPWSLLLLGLAVAAWRVRKTTLHERWRALSPEDRWLIAWSLGGLLVMSFVPSKRVDRIFPIVPPLALLAAAQFHRFSQDQALGPVTRRWTARALVFACLFSSAYSIGKMIIAYRAHAAGLVEFGDAVRREAATRGWRYEVIGWYEEGLLVYLRRTHFLLPREAIAQWKAGAIDAVVAPAEDVPDLLGALPDAMPSGLEGSITIENRPRRYLLLRHR